ncbi:G5 domain-containing protein [Bifidobacterium pseudolongum subsp. globosum]|uniref:G5 domain-containing protein n=1 Tax=Bifidobacterium pseudolongum subsp. globosum TaxID=1690 RepID=A0A4Q4ZZ10_9BIFI|nr:G5 domain-containing protein [Bifidobacterium pseudolongum]RYQ08911.1 G5 domain-containing protein [Bifidobacterium pseudolongum subsp. globosum]
MSAQHKSNNPTLRSLSKRQWMRIAAAAAGVGLVVTGGLATRSIYADAKPEAAPQPTAYSVSDSHAASRGNAREALDGDATYVNVSINGKTRSVLGTNFTDVKSVLDAGDITLESGDTVKPDLRTPVDESTTIEITRAGATMETEESKIPFNTVKKETADLPKGTEKVQTEGEEGILEKTNLVTRSGDTVISSNTFTSYVKKAPVEKVILVGTRVDQPAPTQQSQPSTAQKKGNGSASASIGTTVPVGDMQQWAHDYLLANGGSEADFTATVYIISRESGWSVTATNASSGAYGLAQALPGSKMASHGADWATNYQTQLKWFWDYCKGRYGSIQGAYAFWQANHWY